MPLPNTGNLKKNLNRDILTSVSEALKRERWNNNNKNTLVMCLYLFVHLSDTHKGSKQTEWQAKMWRESHLSAHVRWQSASGCSEPACPLLLHMTPLCITRPGLTALTKSPWSPYICLACHLGIHPCQRKFTACMNNLNAAVPAQQVPGQHQAIFNKRFICAQDQIWS